MSTTSKILVTLGDDTIAMVDEESPGPRQRSATIDRLVRQALGEDPVRSVVRAFLAELAHMKSWRAGSPREALAEIDAGEVSTEELIGRVRQRWRRRK